MGALPIVVKGFINDSDESLIERANVKLTELLNKNFNFSVDRINRITEEVSEGIKIYGYVCVWID